MILFFMPRLRAQRRWQVSGALLILFGVLLNRFNATLFAQIARAGRQLLAEHRGVAVDPGRAGRGGPGLVSGRTLPVASSTATPTRSITTEFWNHFVGDPPPHRPAPSDCQEGRAMIARPEPIWCRDQAYVSCRFQNGCSSCCTRFEAEFSRVQLQAAAGPSVAAVVTDPTFRSPAIISPSSSALVSLRLTTPMISPS